MASTSADGKGKVFVTSDYDVMRKFLLSCDVLIGHNIRRWDIPQLERLLGIKITARIVDTLALSWYLYPSRHKHGLADWGEYFGVKKPEIDDWENLSQEEYEHRCKEDVKINVLLWNKMFAYLLDIYGSGDELWRALDYLSFKLYCAHLQEKSRWKLDVSFCEKSLEELQKIQEEKKTALIAVMPQVPEISIKSKPKRFINKDGSYSKLGQDWIALLTERGLPISHDGDVEVIKGYEPGNPSSPDQLKSWLYSLGWKPRTFKEVKEDDGSIRFIPQVNLEHGKGICESIKDLYEDHPEIEPLEGLSVLQHRIGILKGFLRDHEDGWLQAQVAGLTNTLRFKHTTIVNLPKPDKLFAAAIRGALIASDDDHEQCGADMSSLEDRLKQHYIYPHDPEYVKEMMVEDFDPHLDLASSASALTIEQVLKYKSGEDKKSIDPIRQIYKSGNYSLQYGTGVAKLSRTTGLPKDKAQEVYNAYWKRNWAVKEVAKGQRVKTVDGQMWLFNPVSKLWYSLRFEKDIFSTLVQGTASYVFDRWVQFILEEREQLTGQFHDEIILNVRKGFREACSDLINRAMKRLNNELKLNRELTCGIQFDRAYSGIH